MSVPRLHADTSPTCTSSKNAEQRNHIAGITELVKEIGRGSYGRIFLGKQLKPPYYYFVVKCISIRYADPAKLDEMQRSLEGICKIQSPYLVKLYSFLISGPYLFLYKDYCEGGNLQEYLASKPGSLSETETLIIFRQLIEGYAEVYRRRIIHEDIKMENIMLHQGKVKLSGLSFTSIIDNVDFANIRRTTILSIYGSPQLHRKRRISCKYAVKQPYTNKCDIWAMGVVIFYLLYDRPPIEPKVYMAAVENPEQTKANEPVIDFTKPHRRSIAVEDLLRRMLAYREQDRISWEELFRHPLFQQKYCHFSTMSREYNEATNMFCQYMRRRAIRGYFRIDINDVSEVQLDPNITIVELSERHDRFIEIFYDMMRDRNEAFFYCSILWIYYRFSRRIPPNLNTNREFELALISKAFREARKHDFKYFVNSERPENVATSALWDLFKQSQTYERVRQIFADDLNMMEGLIHAVVAIIKQEGIVSNRVQNIIALHNQVIETEEFHKIYTKIASECIMLLRKAVNIEDPSRLLLEYLEISFVPKHTFKTNKFDFYKFYESFERRFDLSLEDMFGMGMRDYNGIRQKQLEASIVGGLANLMSQSQIQGPPDYIMSESRVAHQWVRNSRLSPPPTQPLMVPPPVPPPQLMQQFRARLQPIRTGIKTTQVRISPVRIQKPLQSNVSYQRKESDGSIHSMFGPASRHRR